MPGLVTFSGLLDTLMVGIHSSRSRRAAILYTPVSAGSPAAGDEARADAPGVDGRPLRDELVDDVLVQLVGGDDRRVGEPCLVQPGAHLLAQVLQVAAVQAHAEVRVSRAP